MKAAGVGLSKIKTFKFVFDFLGLSKIKTFKLVFDFVS